MKLLTRLKNIPPPLVIYDGYQSAINALVDGISPDPDLNFQEFCDTHCIIPKSTGAAHHGKYNSSYTPHVRDVMRHLDVSSPTRRVVVMAASQVWKTQLSLNWLCYIVAQHPSNILMLQPTGTLHKRIINRINKVIAATPRIKDLFVSPNSKTEINNASIKNFQGGGLFLGSSGSASNLSELPAKYAICDEVSRYIDNVGDEGNIIKLVEGRQTTFRDAKSYYFSSPTVKDECKISELYYQGTQRVALAECVHCQYQQELIFENLKIDEKGEAFYPCSSCGGLHYEHDKPLMFKNGLWSDPKSNDGETESFHLSSMFQPYGGFPWTALYNEWLNAKVLIDTKADYTLMQVFYNTRLARPWHQAADTLSSQALIDRSEDYPLGIVPNEATFVTASVDTQDNRFEVSIVGWSKNLESYVVDYHIIHGSPADSTTQSRLKEYLLRSIPHASGKSLKISCTFIDSGGHYTQDVYDFCRRNKAHHIYAIKGASSQGSSIIQKSTMVDINYNGRFAKKGLRLILISPNLAKDFIYSRLANKKGYGVIHFSRHLPVEFFEGVVAEYREMRMHRGRKTFTWVKKDPKAANEPLDLCVYNLAAAYYLQLDRLSDHEFERARLKMGLDEVVDAEVIDEKVEEIEEIEVEEILPKPKVRKTPRVRRGGFMGSLGF
ncbi:phage terminase large subunit GpA-like protein [Nitrosomonas nitrosa]|uniref:phage terminase large subunit family protein n=1 Tax=Nitrosomonas nitrosa TaxID=52442 RepID=UPI000D2FBA60|nr:terminase gpA endonuclease subunit [Nitrosomonas nitrosa]PTR04960.1 phage terminase large subunit GpA-like protein [Nitrosomonas nitrosa]